MNRSDIAQAWRRKVLSRNGTGHPDNKRSKALQHKGRMLYEKVQTVYSPKEKKNQGLDKLYDAVFSLE